jgi:hypothetical protein
VPPIIRLKKLQSLHLLHNLLNHNRHHLSKCLPNECHLIFLLARRAARNTNHRYVLCHLCYSLATNDYNQPTANRTTIFLNTPNMLDVKVAATSEHHSKKTPIYRLHKFLTSIIFWAHIYCGGLFWTVIGFDYLQLNPHYYKSIN